jgi:hypothetical protein
MIGNNNVELFLEKLFNWLSRFEWKQKTLAGAWKKYDFENRRRFAYILSYDYCTSWFERVDTAKNLADDLQMEAANLTDRAAATKDQLIITCILCIKWKELIWLTALVLQKISWSSQVFSVSNAVIPNKMWLQKISYEHLLYQSEAVHLNERVPYDICWCSKKLFSLSEVGCSEGACTVVHEISWFSTHILCIRWR